MRTVWTLAACASSSCSVRLPSAVSDWKSQWMPSIRCAAPKVSEIETDIAMMPQYRSHVVWNTASSRPEACNTPRTEYAWPLWSTDNRSSRMRYGLRMRCERYQLMAERTAVVGFRLYNR